MTSNEQFTELIQTATTNVLKKLKVDKLHLLANELGVSLLVEVDSSKKKKKVKKDLIDELKQKLLAMNSTELVIIAKDIKLPIEIEVKEILLRKIEAKTVTDSGICLLLNEFLEQNPCLQERFTLSCNLSNENDTVKSNNCVPCETQGLYILTIGLSGLDYIVKLGSFAETQGLFKRITSFGGGNHETGSLTNKWFQRFIKQALAEGFTAKFTYYNKTDQQKINITDMNGEQIDMMPYIMRPLESQLFEKYRNSNNYIPPIFGSNCL